MIYTVTLNPSLDYIVSVNHFQAGALNRTNKEMMFPGGKGINVSMVLHNLGIESVALGLCAGFTGQEIIRLVSEYGISTDLIEVTGGMSRINVKVRSKSESNISIEETEINGMGPMIKDDDIDKLYKKLDNLKAGDVLILAGSIPVSLPATMYSDIMQYLQNLDVKIVVDATSKLLLNVLQYHPFLIKPNNYELGEIFGVDIRTRSEAIPYAIKLKEQGARNVLVSMAGEGAVLVAEDGSIYEAEAPKGVVKNSIGAGDSMVAGFIAGYLDESENDTNRYKKAFYMGLCAGSASAFSDGMATKEAIKKLFYKRSNQ